MTLGKHFGSVIRNALPSEERHDPIEERRLITSGNGGDDPGRSKPILYVIEEGSRRKQQHRTSDAEGMLPSVVVAG